MIPPTLSGRRFSIFGIEDIEDLIADMSQALDRVPAS